jgi:hypothetical protein
MCSCLNTTLDSLSCHACSAACCCFQVPWLVIFGVLTLVPQTAVCYYLMLAAWVGAAHDTAGVVGLLAAVTQPQRLLLSDSSSAWPYL